MYYLIYNIFIVIQNYNYIYLQIWKLSFLKKNQGSYWGDHDWEVGDEDDTIARKAYEALLRVSLLQPTSPRFQDFADTVRQRAQTDYNYSFSEGEEVNFLSSLSRHQISLNWRNFLI